MSQYSTGSVAVTHSSTGVVGTGTLWATNIVAGNLFTIRGSNVAYQVASVTDDTHLVLTESYVGTTASAQPYVVSKSFTPETALSYPERGDVETALIVAEAIRKIDNLIGAAITVSEDIDALKAIDYLVKTASSTLSGERVVTNTSTLSWDWATGGQAKASVIDVPDSVVSAAKLQSDAVTTAKIQNAAVTYAKIQNVAANSLIGNPTGLSAASVAVTLAADLEFNTGALRLAAFTGDITKAAGSLATSIGAGKVTFAMLASAAVDTDSSGASASSSKVWTSAAAKAYADSLIAANDAMVFKTAIDCSANPNYPAADKGWTYRVSVAGRIGGASGVVVEVGDIFICNTDSTSSGDQAGVGSAWNVIQTNTDGGVIGPASSTGGNIATFSGTSGKVIQDGGKALPSGTIVGTSDVQTLTNKTLTSPAITTPTGIVKGDVGLGNVDNTSNATERAAAATLTNKTFDAASNTLSNLATSMFAANVIDTDTSLTANSDTRLASQKAVKAYVSAAVAAGVSDGDKGDIVVSSSGSIWTIDTNAVSNAKFRQGVAVSVVGVTGGSTANVADIVAGTNGHVLRRISSSDLSFGTLVAASFADNTIVAARLAASATNVLFGRKTASAGAGEELSASDVRTLTGLATGDSPQFTALNLGHATDTTVTRLSAGVIAVEGNTVAMLGSQQTYTGGPVFKHNGSFCFAGLAPNGTTARHWRLSNAGLLEQVNSAYSAVIWSVDDSGNETTTSLTTTGNVVSNNELTVQGGAAIVKFADRSAASVWGWYSASNIARLYNTGVGDVIQVDTGGSAYNLTGTWGTISDANEKENISEARDYTDDLLQLTLKKYSLKTAALDHPNMLGLVAQDVEKVFPGLVETISMRDGDFEPRDVKSLKSSVLNFMLLDSHNRLVVRARSLETDLQAAIARIKALETEAA